jgi:hypothetical protein
MPIGYSQFYSMPIGYSLFCNMPISYSLFCGILIGYSPFYRIAINYYTQGIHDFLVPWYSRNLQCAWPLIFAALPVCLGSTMCGVTEVKLKLFTILQNSVASIGVTSYYVVGADVFVSRSRNMVVADRSPPSAGLNPGPVSMRILIYRTTNFMLFLQLYFHPPHVACDTPIMTYINSCMFRYRVIINGVSHSAFVG